jgi:hypothetical protein
MIERREVGYDVYKRENTEVEVGNSNNNNQELGCGYPTGVYRVYYRMLTARVSPQPQPYPQTQKEQVEEEVQSCLST